MSLSLTLSFSPGLVGRLWLNLNKRLPPGLGIEFEAKFKVELNTTSSSKTLIRPVVDKTTGQISGSATTTTTINAQTFRIYAFGKLKVRFALQF